MKKEAVRRMGLKFDDNNLLPLLFGEHDCNLAQIEEELDVEIVARGNELIVMGGKLKLKAAQTVFDILWDRLGNGLQVGRSEISAALQVALSPMDESTRSIAVDALKKPNIKVKSSKKTVTARTARQTEYLHAIEKNSVVFGIGPAGTGKTFLAVAKAVEMMLAGIVERIILCRPAIEAGEHLGFLPGTMQEKVDPYLRPIYDALHDMIDPEQIARRLADGSIEIAPLAFMRGRTLGSAIIILDEAQNTTATQMKMALTRIGEDSRMIITGDLTQTDLPRDVKSGLQDAVDVLSDVKHIAFVHFDEKDVVRSKIVKDIVEAYDKKDKTK